MDSEALQKIEKDKIEEQLRQLSSVVQQTADTVVITDKNGFIQYVNPAFEALTGYTLAEVVGKNPRLLQSRKHGPEFYRNLWQTILSGKVFRAVFINKKKSGELYYEEHTISPIKNDDGIITHFVATGKDITDRKHAETVLQESEEKFRQLTDNITEIFWMSDRDFTKVLYVSSAYEKIWGRSCNSLYEDPSSFAEAIHPEDRERALKEMNKQSEGSSFDHEYRIIRPDGSIRWIWDRGFPVRDPSGVVTRFAGIAQDITERKNAEESLHQSEEKFRLAFEDGPVGMALVGEDYKFISANRAFTELVGYTEEELRNFNFEQLTHPEDAGADLDLAAELFRGEIPNYKMEKRYIKKNGESVWVQLTATLLRDSAKKRRYGFAMVENIHQRKQAEERLEAQRAVTRVLAESLTLGEAAPGILAILCSALHWDFGSLWMADRRSNAFACRYAFHSNEPSLSEFGEISRGLELPFGAGFLGVVCQSKEPLLITKLDEQRNCIRADAAMKAGFQEALFFPVFSGHKVTGIFEFFSRQPRETDSTLIQLISSLASQMGQFTQRKQSEDEKVELEKQLFQMRKMEAIGQLAGGVAHDFNNILMAITGYVELLKYEIAENSQGLRYLSTLGAVTEQGANLTRQLLAFGRKQVLTPTILDCNHLLTEMKEMVQRLIGEDVQLFVKPGKDLGCIQADPSQIQQVIMNLAVNARDAMSDGGKLFIETSNVCLTSEEGLLGPETQSGECVALTVKDTGCGMDEKIVAHIFEPFFTTKQEGKGTGLGLSTVYGIVKQSGGSIEVSTKPGSGTTFNIYFPRVDLAPVVVRSEAVVDTLGKGETILVVDDNESVRASIAAYLELKNYRVLQASDGRSACTIAENHTGNIDVLLSDVVMPGMTGPALADSLKSRDPKLKILFMSGYSEKAIDLNGDLREDAHFLMKPAPLGEILRKIRGVLSLE